MIATWEHDQIRDKPGTDLPRAEDPFHDLIKRSALELWAFSLNRVSPSLHQEVMETIFRTVAWNGRRDLNAVVILGRLDGLNEDAAVEALAKYLRARRYRTGKHA
jgi:hypothetical protein